MAKNEFNRKAIAVTLVNQAYEAGKLAMQNLNAKNKGQNISPDVLDTYSNSYLLSSMQLENLMLNDLTNNNQDSWVIFADSYNKINDDEKVLFRGVIRDVKKAAQNVLSGAPKPFEGIGELPFYPTVLPYYAPSPNPFKPNKPLWQEVYAHAEQLEATARYTHDDVDGAAAVIGSVGAVVGGYGAATGNVPAATAGAVIGAVGGAVHLVNTGMEAVANWVYGN